MTTLKPILIFSALGAAALSNAALYDFTADFSLTGNPNGAWSYGYRTSLASARTVHSTSLVSSNNLIWYTPGLSGDATPSVFKRTGPDGDGVMTGQAGMHPGPSGEYASLLFTAPESGDLTLESIFGRGDNGAVDLQVRVNGLTLYSATGVTDERSFNLTTPVAVTAGSTLEILVGTAGDYRFDSTPLTARVNIGSPVPEPASMAALGLGALALIRRRRAR